MTSQLTIEERLSLLKNQIETTLDSLVPEKPGPHALLYQAARYSLLSPAKRLRPLLMLAAAEDLDASADHALIPACAIEMIHTYSLIHDDLPCMDDDDLRRGRPTLHNVYPEGQALLAGDFLLTYAFEIASTAPNLADSQKIDLIASLSKASGGDGMIGGQVIDLLIEGSATAPSWALLSDMHTRKTAALIACALECGAIIANASPSQKSLLREAGIALGIAFQIVDDILDVIGSEEEIGKPVGSDARNAKMTAVTHHGLKGAQSLAHSLLEKAESALSQLPSPDLLLAISQKFIHRFS